MGIPINLSYSITDWLAKERRKMCLMLKKKPSEYNVRLSLIHFHSSKNHINVSWCISVNLWTQTKLTIRQQSDESFHDEQKQQKRNKFFCRIFWSSETIIYDKNDKKQLYVRVNDINIKTPEKNTHTPNRHPEQPKKKKKILFPATWKSNAISNA